MCRSTRVHYQVRQSAGCLDAERCSLKALGIPRRIALLLSACSWLWFQHNSITSACLPSSVPPPSGLCVHSLFQKCEFQLPQTATWSLKGACCAGWPRSWGPHSVSMH